MLASKIILDAILELNLSSTKCTGKLNKLIIFFLKLITSKIKYSPYFLKL